MGTESKVVIGIVLATLLILGGGIFLANTKGTGALGSAVGDMAMLLRTDRPIRGPGDAKVTIVEFADFQCPACGAAYPVLKALVAAYPQQVRLVFRHFPLTELHQNALLAAEAAEAARAQGKFWEMYDTLFEGQSTWSDLSDSEARSSFEKYAQTLGLDLGRFKQEISAGTDQARIQEDRTDGTSLGVRGTPTLFINGREYTGSVTLPALKTVVDEQLKN